MTGAYARNAPALAYAHCGCRLCIAQPTQACRKVPKSGGAKPYAIWSYKGPSINNVGNSFLIFDTPSPILAVFSVEEAAAVVSQFLSEFSAAF